MNGRIIAVGDTDGPYHPLDNIRWLGEALPGCRITFTDDYDAFLRLPEFDLCICYTDAFAGAGRKPLGPERSAALLTFLRRGGRMLILHNGVSLQDTPELSGLLGARFCHHPPRDTLLIQIMRGHPVTESAADFCIWDEPYQFDVYGPIEVFASYTYQGKAQPAGWERPYGAWSLIYLMPGHDRAAFQCEAYRRLVVSCAAYLMGK